MHYSQHRKKCLFAILLGFLFTIPWASATTSSGLISDIVYKTVGGEQLRLNIYRPANSLAELPVIAYLHGGGWATGSRQDIHRGYREHILQALLENGYAVASIEYRLNNTQGSHFPNPIVDSKDAVRWLRKHAGEYNLDPESIGVWGSSAGGHLAMMVAYSPDAAYSGTPELSRYSSKVNYVLNNFGPTDLTSLFRPELPAPLVWILKSFKPELHQKRQARLTALTGLNIETDQDQVTRICVENSPLHHLAQGGGVPTLTFHGGADKLVPPEQAELLNEALGERRVRHQLVLIENGKHGLRDLNPSQIEDMTRQTLAFIEKYRAAPTGHTGKP